MIIFYDGGCALCHGFVRFVIANGSADIRFAPVEGARMGTIVVRLEEGIDLQRSDAVIAVLQRCGRSWKAIASSLRLIPRPIRDFAYETIAAVRYRVFGRTNDVCPMLPPELRSRILDPQTLSTPRNFDADVS